MGKKSGVLTIRIGHVFMDIMFELAELAVRKNKFQKQ
jgi:hypothetical protein